MESIDFNKLVEDAIDELPKEFSQMLENINITIQAYPSGEQISYFNKRDEKRPSAQRASGSESLLLGLYQGIPKTKRGNYGIGGPLPDKITIFKIPLMMISKSPDDLKERVKKTVKHEIAHHFGLTDEEIRKRNH